MSRAVGVEIGTSAVRAVEVRSTAVGPEVVRFGQVALRAGTVRDGEVVDGAAVAEALKRLWADAGFKAKDVVIGSGVLRGSWCARPTCLTPTTRTLPPP